ncbi:hypothetical protein RBSWK_02935 [Rhodopirellula baltica SWK14]|uniref:Uncharacterized protein n=1 Tax=Rhodopirellula baltica SWK14 TaxID=993516 RepID=L7CFS2_RHOBT|nr:hypothetical protein RBSWK_02935 [Rhodopirellula baltica SWK14]
MAASARRAFERRDVIGLTSESLGVVMTRSASDAEPSLAMR